MKTAAILLALCFCNGLLAQQQKFDITTYTPPKGWQKQSTESTVQFSKEDKATGAYCIIMLMKAIPGTADAKANFDAAWETVVKEAVTVNTAPEMQPAAKEDGWEAQTGYAPFESEGNKGIALLVTSSGFQKMINILILTNSDVYEKEMSAFLESVSFQKPPPEKPVANTQPGKQVTTPPASPSAKKDGYAFNTTNFDDGWTSTVQEDWVEVTKGDIKVLLHYPREGTIFPADPEPLTNAAWNILVAPRYSDLTNYKTYYITDYKRYYFGMGNVRDKATGKNVFVLLFRRSNDWIEFVAPDENSFAREFGIKPSTRRRVRINEWSSEDVVDNNKGQAVPADESNLYVGLENMVTRNKFAIGAADLNGTGKWTNKFANNTFYYNIYTGNSAGMSTYTSAEEFTFLPNQKYKWNLAMANSGGGVTNFATGKAEGNWKMNNNWEIWFSKLEKNPKRYNAFFSCIKGARILNLLDADYPGSGMYSQYGMVK